jgi:hypothetical protein
VGSPAIDAGNPADLGNARDVAGDPRLVDGDKDGDARRDIGAFEWQQPVVVASTGGGDSEPTPPAGSAGTGDPGAESASPIATATSVDRTPPIIGKLRIDRRRRLSFSVSEQSVVHVVIKKRRSSGRMRPVASLERPFMPGVRRFAIGRVRGKALPRGSYTATVIASDAAQNRSRVQIVRFRVG